MENVLTTILYLSLGIHIAMMGVACWRVWRGENVIDRLMASDVLTTLTQATLVLVSLIGQKIIYIDVALGLAALGFVGTIALAKYLADEQMF